MKLDLTPRCTRITADRAAQMIKVIEALKAGPLPRYEVDRVLGISPSGCRKYVTDLTDNKIVLLLAPAGAVKVPVSDQMFFLNDDGDRVAEFVRLITLPGLDGQPRRRGPLMQAAEARHVHIAKDDEPVKVRLASTKPPAMHYLLAQFFGLGQATA